MVGRFLFMERKPMILDKKIQIFLTVAKAGSFSQGSRQLGLSPSVVSFHIDALEKYLGVSLFDRHGRSISLSKEGKFLLDKTLPLAQEAELLEETFSKHSRKISLCIHLAGDALTCAYILPNTLSGFRTLEPDVSFTYDHLNQETMISGIVNGELDIALVGYHTSHKKLAVQECFHDDIVFIGLPSLVPEKISAQELRMLPLLWITSDRGLELALKAALAKVGITPNNLNIFMEVTDLPILKMLIREGVGSAFLPRLAVEDELKYSLLREVEVEGVKIQRTTYLLYNKEREPREIVSRFLDFAIKNGQNSK